MKRFFWCITAIAFVHCQSIPLAVECLQDQVEHGGLIGRAGYLSSPFVTAGDRLYMVGHQDGSFPDLGWHVPGEMGGIWDHPIKLMDGFVATLTLGNQTNCLLEADTFINFPFANLHHYSPLANGIEVERFQFIPDGQEAVVVEYTFKNSTDSDQQIYFTWTGYSDLRPVWLGEQTGMKDGPDLGVWLEDLQAWLIKDSLNDWYVVFGSTKGLSNRDDQAVDCAYRPQGKGVPRSLVYELLIPAEGTISLPITIAGSSVSSAQTKENFLYVSQAAGQLLIEKQQRYRELAGRSLLTVPDTDIQQAFEWMKYNTDWLIRDVPGVGRGLSAGFPDYPWWFGADSEYALQGALAIGRFDLVYSTIDLLHQLSEKSNGNGRIIHEASTNGAVYNPGNINETPQFISLVRMVYDWTGDRDFLEKYFPTVQKGLEWLLAANDPDGDLIPDGFGMMEIHDLDCEMIDVACYTQRAFSDAAKLAIAMRNIRLAAEYEGKANRLRQKINRDFWVPEHNSFADFISTPGEALQLIDEAIVRADTLGRNWAVDELEAAKTGIAGLPPQQERAFVLHHNWVVNTPMETGVADPEKALAALETDSSFANSFGVYVTGLDREEKPDRNGGLIAAGHEVFTYTGAVMTLPTGVQAVAENNYGRPDQALEYLKRLTRSFSFALPGSIYEISPDYGMMTQAWNLYGYAVPVVQQFFGLRPGAPERKVRIQPQMPGSWKQAKLENVLVGENQVDIHYDQQETALALTIRQSGEGWTCEIAFPADRYNTWELNGTRVEPEMADGYDLLKVQDKVIRLKLY